MQKFLVRLFFAILATVCALSGALFIPSVQKWGKERSEYFAGKALGKKVQVGAIHGLIPFVFSFSDVTIFDESVASFHADAIRLIPSWPEMAIGRPSFIHVYIKDVHLTLTPYLASQNGCAAPLASFLPQKKFRIYSFRCDGLSLDENYNLKGRLSFNPKKKTISAHLEVSSPLRFFELGIKAHDKEFCASLYTKLSTIPSPTQSLEKVESRIDLVSQNEQIFSLLWGGVKPEKKETVALFHGSTSLSATFTHNQSLFFQNVFTATEEGIFNFTNKKLQIGATPVFGDIEGCFFVQDGAWNFQLKSPTLRARHLEVNEMESLISFSLEKKELRGTAQTKGKIQNQPFLLSMFLQQRQGVFAIHSIKGSVGACQIKGDLTCQLYPLLFSGSIEATSSDLKAIGLIINRPLTGQGKLSCSFSERQEGGQQIEANLTLKSLRSTGFYFDELGAEVVGTGTFPDILLQTKISGKKGQIKQLGIDEIDLAFGTTLSNGFLGPFSLQGKGMIDSRFWSGRVLGQSSPDSITFDCINFDLNDKKASLASPVKIDFSKKALIISPLEIVWNKESFLKGSLNWKSRSLTGNFEALNVPVDPLHFFFPSSHFKGTFSGNGTVDLTDEKSFCDIDLSSDGLSFQLPHSETSAPFGFGLHFNINGQKAKFDGLLNTGTDRPPLTFSLEGPIERDLISNSFEIPKHSPIRGSVSGELDLDSLCAPFLKEGDLLQGTINCDLSLSGTFFNPNLSGTISCQNGKFDIPKVGGILSNISFCGHCKNNRLEIDTINATDESGGKLHAKGFIEPSFEKLLSYSFTFNTDKLEIIRLDFAHVVGTGIATLTGTTQEATFTGNFMCDSAELNLGENFTSNLPSLDVTFVDETEFDTQIISPFSFNLDLAANLAEGKGMIAGRGLKSYWKGDINLKGASQDLVATGDLIATKGTFAFADKEFALKQGACHFAGDLFGDSKLNVIAEHGFDMMTCQIILRGSIDKPRISFAATPAAAQNEILSCILFQKPFAQISAIEGLQLATILMELRYGNSKYNVVNNLKKGLGIDNIDIIPSDSPTSEVPSNGVTVQVSKKLSKDVLLRVSKDVATAINRVAIEATLNKGFYFQAEVGDDQEGKMALKWKHDY